MLFQILQVSDWIFIYPEFNPFPWNLTKILYPGKWRDLDLIQQKANVHSKTSLMLNCWILKVDTHYNQSKQSFVYLLKKRKKDWKVSVGTLPSLQAWKLNSGFLQMAGLQGICQCDGKNESLSLVQDSLIASF